MRRDTKVGRLKAITIRRRPDAVSIPWLLFWVVLGLLVWTMILGGCAMAPTPRNLTGEARP